MRETRNIAVWVCELEDCGHWWIAKTETPPALCASCGRRGWHKTKSTAELVREKGADLDDRLRALIREVLAESPRQTVPMTPAILPPRQDIESLRDICAGITTPPATAPPSDWQPCLYTEYDQDTGETYRCGLSIHPPKVKHTRGAAV